MASDVPIYKGKGDRSLLLNYQLMSLTAILSKVTEFVLARDIHKHLDTEQLLNDCQYEFKAQKRS